MNSNLVDSVAGSGSKGLLSVCHVGEIMAKPGVMVLMESGGNVMFEC